MARRNLGDLVSDLLHGGLLGLDALLLQLDLRLQAGQVPLHARNVLQKPEQRAGESLRLREILSDAAAWR